LAAVAVVRLEGMAIEDFHPVYAYKRDRTPVLEIR
jgi:hypothetical protein